MKDKNGGRFKDYLLSGIVVCLIFSLRCPAVTSNVTRHSTNVDLLKGKTVDVVVGSKGILQLGRAAETLVEDFEDVWSINSVVVSGGAVFLGTSPNGGIYKYSLGKLTKIYPAQSQDSKDADSNQTEDTDVVKAEQHLSNEHIFVMSSDVSGRLLAGVSGEKCILLRLEKGEMKTIFEPEDAKYIFGITVDDTGSIYLGTGPEGKVYKLDSFGKKPQVIYDSKDKNILSLAVGADGFVYAGSDSRGLIYRIDPGNESATVLYDSDQPEITALLFTGADDGDLYAAATLAEITQAQKISAPKVPLAGRPESKKEEGKSQTQGEDEKKLQIANTKGASEDKPSTIPVPPRKDAKPGKASYIYRITKDGYVTEVFSEGSVFFALEKQDNNLILATGNEGRTFMIEPDSEQQVIIYEDRQASQITAIAVTGADVYLGTANPAKLIRLKKIFASEGTYISDLIDASQPAKWGKLQIDADIPKGCKVSLACRSGNVKDINDPTFSQWTDPVEVTEPVQLQCPVGRFCQYKLILQSRDGTTTPVVREIAVANTVPNLAPKVETVSVEPVGDKDKTGVFKIGYRAEDKNNDKLIYRIDFRKVGRKGWIEIKDQLEEASFEWDGRTVEDGRYEIRVTASDEKGNTTITKLTSSRISEQVVVDNTGPVLDKFTIDRKGQTATLKLFVSDQFSAIGKVEYTVDSNADWAGAMPDDLVYDTMKEHFTIVIEEVEPGDHVIAVKISDDVGNTTYRTFDLTE